LHNTSNQKKPREFETCKAKTKEYKHLHKSNNETTKHWFQEHIKTQKNKMMQKMVRGK
jgi:hypothetical protein